MTTAEATAVLSRLRGWCRGQAASGSSVGPARTTGTGALQTAAGGGGGSGVLAEALLGLTELTTINFVVQFLIGLVGLGVAIDYALLVTTRWREESARLPADEAVVAAMTTAGRSVVFSGLTVAVGLLSLVVLPVQFLRSMGIGGVLIPLVSVAAAA